MTRNEQRGLQDAQLRRYLDKNLVEKLQIWENEKERYEIHATLKWKIGTLPILTTRGKIRGWVSVDRMVKHLKTNNAAIKIDWHIKI